MKRFYSIFIFSLLMLLCSCERPTDVTEDDDGIPPAVPTGLTIYSATDGEILIEWNGNTEKDITGYNIYRKVNDSDFEKVFFTTNDYYYDDSLNYSDEYSYKINAADNTGKESSFTGIVSAKPLNRYKPHAPWYLNINAQNWLGKKLIFLQWQQSEETDISGYNIYRGESEDFKADSSTIIGFSEIESFSDTSVQEFYKKFYYKVRAVDKGGLLSNETYVVQDEIYEIPSIVFPEDKITTEYFPDFKIKAIGAPATYRIIVQTNKFYGEFWSKEVTSTIINDTLSISFSASGLEANKKYYWRIVTYSESSEPNSISQLYSFTLKQ